MPNLFKDLYNKAETLKGKKLAITLAVTFVTFLGLGVLIGYIINTNLNKNEIEDAYEQALTKQVEQSSFTGRVIFTNPINYPGEKISFFLEGQNGEKIILLKARDSKIEVVEGLDVTVKGEVELTKGGEQVLNVKEIIISNASN